MTVMKAQKLAKLTDLEIVPVTPNIGARIHGIDASGPLSDAVIATIRAALLKHKVIFLPGQNLDADAFLEFAERFGSTTLHNPVATSTADQTAAKSAKAQQNVWTRDNSYRSDHWHTDVTFIDRPVAISLLHCLASPGHGGDTMFANTVTAYEALPPPLRTLADGLRVIHSIAPRIRENQLYHLSREAAGNADPNVRKLAARGVNAESFITEHPLVRVHSETAERSLMLGSFAESFLGLPLDVARALIEIFQRYITLPENLVRWSWTPGDLAMWDNRATQHYAVNDYGNADRLMQRLTIAGGIPVGVDGRQSLALSGDASAFSDIGVG
jgi:taurine dioxygenase